MLDWLQVHAVPINWSLQFLTVVAFVLAIWQTIQASAQNKQNRTHANQLEVVANESRMHANQLEVVANALSTRYIGPFPEYVAEIPKLIAECNSELRILCSVPIHGAFNSTTAWLQTKQAIERLSVKSPPTNIVCIFSNKNERIRLQLLQYRRMRSNWNDWISSNENSMKMMKFLKRFSKDKESSEANFDSFISCLESAAEIEINTTFRFARVSEVPYVPPIFLWIVDNSKAIFVLRTTEPEFKAEAFWTSDGRLVQSLVQIHQSYLHESETQNLIKSA